MFRKLYNYSQGKLNTELFSAQELEMLVYRDTIVPYTPFINQLRSQQPLQASEADLYIHSSVISLEKEEGRVYLELKSPLQRFFNQPGNHWKKISILKFFLTPVLETKSPIEKRNILGYLNFLSREFFFIYKEEDAGQLIVQSFYAFYRLCKMKRDPALFYGLIEAASQSYVYNPDASYYPNKLYTCPKGLKERIYLTCAALARSEISQHLLVAPAELYTKHALGIFNHAVDRGDVSPFLISACLAAMFGSYRIEELPTKKILSSEYYGLFEHSLRHHYLAQLAHTYLYSLIKAGSIENIKGCFFDGVSISNPQQLIERLGIIINLNQQSSPISLSLNSSSLIIYEFNKESLKFTLEDCCNLLTPIIIEKLAEGDLFTQYFAELLQPTWYHEVSSGYRQLIFDNEGGAYDLSHYDVDQFPTSLAMFLSSLLNWPSQLIEAQLLASPVSASQLIEYLQSVLDYKDRLPLSCSLIPFSEIKGLATFFLNELDVLAMSVITSWLDQFHRLSVSARRLVNSYLSLFHLTPSSSGYKELIERLVDAFLIILSSHENERVDFFLSSINPSLLKEILSSLKLRDMPTDYESIRNKFYSWACEELNIECLKFLIEDGVAVNHYLIDRLPNNILESFIPMITAFGDPLSSRYHELEQIVVLHAAALANNILLVKRVLFLHPTVVFHVNGLLMELISCGYLELVEVLLRHGVRDNSGDDVEKNLLHYAVERRDPVLLNLLLSFNPVLSIKNHQRLTPFESIIQKNDLVLAQAFLSFYPDVLHEYDCYGWTPLHRAVYGGDINFVLLLLNHYADLNKCTLECVSVLSIAVEQEHVELCRLLLERGACPLGLSYPCSPFEWAQQYTHDFSEKRTTIATLILEKSTVVLSLRNQSLIYSKGITFNPSLPDSPNP